MPIGMQDKPLQPTERTEYELQSFKISRFVERNHLPLVSSVDDTVHSQDKATIDKPRLMKGIYFKSFQITNKVD